MDCRAPRFFHTQRRERAEADRLRNIFLHESGEVIAFGRDPYFPPWHDTAQLDYTNPDLRWRMIRSIKVDQHGRRRRALRHGHARAERLFPPAVVYATLRPRGLTKGCRASSGIRPSAKLKPRGPISNSSPRRTGTKSSSSLSIGFDLTYEKKVYDGLVAHNAQAIIDRVLSLGRRARRLALFYRKSRRAESRRHFQPRR